MTADASSWPLRDRRDARTLVAFVLALFAGLAALGVVVGPATSTETRYAQMGREMVESGDWIVPTLNGAPLLEKPPFEYWVNAASFAIFGPSDLTARIPSLLAGLLVVLVTAVGARRLAPADDAPSDRVARGRLAALALVTMPAFLMQAYTISTDIWLVLGTTIAGLAVLAPPRADGRLGLGPTLVLHAAMGVGMLVKGPLTLALVLLASVVTAIARRDARPLARFVHPLGLLLLVAIATPWYVAANARIPGLLHDLVSRRLFGGLASAQDFHSHSVWVVWLPLIGAFPWLAALLRTASDGLRRGGWRRGPLLPLLLLALAAPLLFTFSKSRLVSYASPSFPWIALVVATGWPAPATVDARAASRRGDLARATLGGAVVAFATCFIVVLSGTTPVLVATAAAGAALALAAGLLAPSARRARSLLPRVALVGTGLLLALAAGIAANPARLGASKPLWDAIAKVRRPGEELGAVLPYTGDWGLLPWNARELVRFFDYPSKPMIVAPEGFAPERFLPKAALAPWFRSPERRFLLIRERDLGRADYLGDLPAYRVADGHGDDPVSLARELPSATPEERAARDAAIRRAESGPLGALRRAFADSFGRPGRYVILTNRPLPAGI